MLAVSRSLPEAKFMNYLWSLCCIHEYHLPSLMCSWHPEIIFDLFFNFSHSLISQFILSYFIEHTASELFTLRRYKWRHPVWSLRIFFFFFLCNSVSLVVLCRKWVWWKYIYWIELKEPEGNLNALILFCCCCCFFLNCTELNWACHTCASPSPRVFCGDRVALTLWCFTNGCYTLPLFLSNVFFFLLFCFSTLKSCIDESWLAR